MEVVDVTSFVGTSMAPWRRRASSKAWLSQEVDAPIGGEWELVAKLVTHCQDLPVRCTDGSVIVLAGPSTPIRGWRWGGVNSAPSVPTTTRSCG